MVTKINKNNSTLLLCDIINSAIIHRKLTSNGSFQYCLKKYIYVLSGHFCAKNYKVASTIQGKFSIVVSFKENTLFNGTHCSPGLL